MYIYYFGKSDFNKLINYLSGFDVISLDIFETTFIRLCDDASEVFKSIEEKRDMADFSVKRMQAQVDAQKDCGLKTNIHDIYKRLAEKAVLTPEQSESLKELEILTEIEYIIPNKTIVDAVRKLNKMGKRIVFTSDMYIPSDFVQKMVDTIIPKVVYDDILVSCDYGKAKHDGSLFEVLKEKYKGNRIVHIGDYWKSDYLMPVSKGVSAVYAPFKKNINSFDKFVTYSVSDGEGYIRKWAFRDLAPALWSFCVWLERNFRQDKCMQAAFITREGALFGQLFQIYDTENEFKKYILYASRRSILCASGDINWEWIPRTFGNSPTSFLVDAYKLNPNMLEEGEKNTKIKDLKRLDSFKENIASYSKKQRALLMKMLKMGLDLEGNIAFVDIGWKGSSQLFLTRVFEAEGYDVRLYGNYLGSFYDPNNTSISKKGFLCSEQDNRFKEAVLNAGFVFENCLSPEFGTTVGYEENGGIVRPILDQEKKENDSLVNEIQEELFEFFNIFSTKRNLIEVTEINTIERLFKRLNHPNRKMAVALGDISYRDFGETRYVAKPELPGWKYLLNPKQFAKEIHYSGWNSGFCLRAFKLKLPYYEIYSFLKRKSEGR